MKKDVHHEQCDCETCQQTHKSENQKGNSQSLNNKFAEEVEAKTIGKIKRFFEKTLLGRSLMKILEILGKKIIHEAIVKKILDYFF